MSGYVKMIFLSAVLSCASLLSAYSQPKSVGTSFSFSNIGIVYEHQCAPDTFLGISLRTETSEMFAGRKDYPGISAAASWNIIFKEWESSEGNSIRLFAGPGAVLGWTADNNDFDGMLIGLRGAIGGECLFDRKIAISVSIAPVLGAHIVNRLNHSTMKLYKNGIYYSLIPEIGIKYTF